MRALPIRALAARTTPESIVAGGSRGRDLIGDLFQRCLLENAVARETPGERRHHRDERKGPYDLGRLRSGIGRTDIATLVQQPSHQEPDVAAQHDPVLGE
jgi:hypothetical protein